MQWEPGPLPAQGANLLALIAQGLAGYGIAVPQRQFRALGTTPAWDDEQLTVSFISLDQGQPGATSGGIQRGGMETQMVSWLVQLVMAVPALNDVTIIPTAQEQDAAAVLAMEASEALWRTLVDIRADGQLFRPPLGGAIGPLIPIGPSGGLLGYASHFSYGLA